MDQHGENQLVNETIELLKAFKSNLLPCIRSAKSLLLKLNDNQLNTEDGISLFDLKNKMFLSYLVDLVFVVNKKLNGETISDNIVLERLVEERAVLEKIRPIEHKLKYQVDKLMKVLNTGTIDGNDPLNLKPDFSNIASTGQEDEECDLNDTDANDQDNTDNKEYGIKKSKSGIYVPPRLAQMQFEDEEERKSKVLERAKKRAISSSIIKELKKEFDDAPEEEYDSLLHQKSGIGKYLKEKRRFEEDNFIRLNLTKKQKQQARKLATVNTIADDITRFEDISVLDIKNPNEFVPQKKAKSRPNNKNKKSKKRFNKRK